MVAKLKTKTCKHKNTNLPLYENNLVHKFVP